MSFRYASGRLINGENASRRHTGRTISTIETTGNRLATQRREAASADSAGLWRSAAPAAFKEIQAFTHHLQPVAPVEQRLYGHGYAYRAVAALVAAYCGPEV